MDAFCLASALTGHWNSFKTLNLPPWNYDNSTFDITYLPVIHVPGLKTVWKARQLIVLPSDSSASLENTSW